MQIKSMITAIVLLGLFSITAVRAQIAASQQDFQQLAAALKANDAERRSAIATCIRQGIGENPVTAARFMNVPVERAAEA